MTINEATEQDVWVLLQQVSVINGHSIEDLSRHTNDLGRAYEWLGSIIADIEKERAA